VHLALAEDTDSRVVGMLSWRLFTSTTVSRVKLSLSSRIGPTNRAGSTGRCNTIQCVDSTMLPRENRSVWLYSGQNLARVVFRLI